MWRNRVRSFLRLVTIAEEDERSILPQWQTIGRSDLQRGGGDLAADGGLVGLLALEGGVGDALGEEVAADVRDGVLVHARQHLVRHAAALQPRHRVTEPTWQRVHPRVTQLPSEIQIWPADETDVGKVQSMVH